MTNYRRRRVVSIKFANASAMQSRKKEIKQDKEQGPYRIAKGCQ
jgi:hypothetical protein